MLPLVKLAKLFTGRNEVVAKVIFLHLSVIHSVHRGGSASVHAGIPHRSRHPWEQTPPGADTRPRADTPLGADPPGADTPLEQTPPGSRLRYTVNERPVRILLECILVLKGFWNIKNARRDCSNYLTMLENT